MLINTKKTKKLLALVILINVVLLVAYTGAFVFVKSQGSKSAKTYLELLSEKQKQENIDTVRITVKNTTAERAKLKDYFVTQTEVILFIDKVESLGAESNTNITLNDLKEIDEGKLVFSITATGAFDSLMHLLALIENIPYNIEIKQVSFRKVSVSEEKKDIVWEGSFSAELLSFRK